jgi:hypothetical protein
MKRKHLFFIPLIVLINASAYPQFHVFFGNLHSHTSYSDGSLTPTDAYNHARNVAGIDFLAVTEHNHVQAPSRIAVDHELYSGAGSASLISTAHRLNDDGHFVAIYGQEFSSISSSNHANVFEVGEVISTDDVPNGQWDKLLNTWLPGHSDSQGQPAIMLLNHPSISSCPNNVEYGIDDFTNQADWRNALDAHAHLINIINGPAKNENEPEHDSEGEFLRYLNLGLHVAPTADQDNHLPNWGDAASTRTGVIAASLTKANILDALRNRHVYASQDSNLRVIGKVNGQLMGKRFTGAEVPATGTDLQMELDIKDNDEPNAIYTIDVYSDVIGGTSQADVIKQFTKTGDGIINLSGIKYTEVNQYFFVKITQSDPDFHETDRAWLAPVWFEPNAATSAAVNVPALTLSVNEALEEAVITNISDSEINLKNWVVRSVIGDQRFTFSANLMLASGASVTVTSGSNAKQQLPQFVKWITANMWSNSGDPGQLIDPAGIVRAETQ